MGARCCSAAKSMITISILESDIFTTLRSFILSVLPIGTEVIQGQDNLVSMPTNSGFVTMTPAGIKRLNTNIQGGYVPGSSNPGTMTLETHNKYEMQLDFYGSNSADWSSIFQTVFRDDYAWEIFPPNIKPLYADDPMQMPLIDGEEQYEQRWRVSCFMQYNPVTTVNQDFAVNLQVGLKEVDTTFKP